MTKEPGRQLIEDLKKPEVQDEIIRKSIEAQREAQRKALDELAQQAQEWGEYD